MNNIELCGQTIDLDNLQSGYFNMDCMAGMAKFPDKYFDLAVVDPPYGLGIDGQKLSISKNPKHNRKEHPDRGWDKSIPPEDYFLELERVSMNQIIWGGNSLFLICEKGIEDGLSGIKGNMDSRCRIVNLHIHRLTVRPEFESLTGLHFLKMVRFIRRKSQSSFTHGFLKCSQNTVTRLLILTSDLHPA